MGGCGKVGGGFGRLDLLAGLVLPDSGWWCHPRSSLKSCSVMILGFLKVCSNG